MMLGVPFPSYVHINGHCALWSGVIIERNNEFGCFTCYDKAVN